MKVKFKLYKKFFLNYFIFLLIFKFYLVNSLIPTNISEDYRGESLLGSCYKIKKYGSKSCGRLLEENITKEECCSSPNQRGWSNSNQTRSMYKSGRVCTPCLDSPCSKTTCGADEECIVRSGKAKCVCAPQCQLQTISTVCGSDQRTYPTECHLLKRACRIKKKLFVAYNGPCETCSGVRCGQKKKCVLNELLIPKCKRCPTHCPVSKIRPICAVTGETYASSCHLKKASCEVGYDIAAAYRGPCTKHTTCDDVKCGKGERCHIDPYSGRPKCTLCSHFKNCKPTQRHVCASDGKNYLSQCALRHEACRSGSPLAAIPQSMCYQKQNKTIGKIKKCITLLKRIKKKQEHRKRKRLHPRSTLPILNYTESFYEELEELKHHNITQDTNTAYTHKQETRKRKKKRVKECQHIVSGRLIVY